MVLYSDSSSIDLSKSEGVIKGEDKLEDNSSALSLTFKIAERISSSLFLAPDFLVILTIFFVSFLFPGLLNLALFSSNNSG